MRFGDTLALKAFAVSETEAYALTPSLGAGVVGVTLQNLDDAGVAIPGESVTLAAAYTFARPDLAREGRVAVVVRALLRALKREVLENTVLTTHTDYDSAPGDGLSVLDVAALPALVVTGPRMSTSRFYATNERRTIAAAGGVFYHLRPAETVDLAFTLLGVTDHTRQIQNLMVEARTFFQRNPYLVVPDEVLGAVRYEMQASFEGLAGPTRTSESNVRQFSGEFVVRGVDLDEEDMRVDVSREVHDYIPETAPTYSEQDSSRPLVWPVILGSNANAPVTPANTPADGVDFEQIPPGEEQ